jgi:GntR family transcriptional regulator, transcriptional repressor for pyruvate dehydrogenase complex
MTRPPVFERQQRSTVPGDIVNEIQRQIANGTLQDGDQLPSTIALAASLGVSRAALREALHRLSALGVVDIQHGRGTFVRTRDARIESSVRWVSDQRFALQELFEFRTAVETAAARLAALKATAEEIAAMATVLARLTGRNDDAAYVVGWDADFHRAIFQAARNRPLQQALAVCEDYLTETRYRLVSMPADITESIDEHQRILLAIRERDPDGAGQAMREHLRSVGAHAGVELP